MSQGQKFAHNRPNNDIQLTSLTPGLYGHLNRKGAETSEPAAYPAIPQTGQTKNNLESLKKYNACPKEVTGLAHNKPKHDIHVTSLSPGLYGYLGRKAGERPRPALCDPTKPAPAKYDIQLTSLQPGVYGHLGRQANTDSHIRLLEMRQKLDAAEITFLAAEAKRLLGNAITEKYDKHFEKKTFQRLIQERFKEKIRQYDESIDKRRAKLRELLCEEEQVFILETIDKAQKGVETKMEDMKQRANMLKQKREDERMQVVKEKRIQQQMKDCVELRPYMIHRNLMETKECHLQQMRENEARKEAEREREEMYHQLMMKEIHSKMERDEQDMLKRDQVQQDMMDTWDKQIEGKNLLRKEVEQVAAEDRIEMIKLQEQIRREEIEALDAKRRKRDRTAVELHQQIKEQEQLARQRKDEEKALDRAFSHLAAEEIRREREQIQNTSEIAKKETARYRQYLRELEEERKREDQQLNQLLDEHKKAIEKKQEEAYCKLKWAREKLRQDVMKGREEQLLYKRQEAENQLKLKEAQNEFVRMIFDTNERLQAETDRLEAEKVREYREDLMKQIKENAEKRQEEQEQLRRELEHGIEEEKKYRQLVEDLKKLRVEGTEQRHPFRRVIERDQIKYCLCPDQ